MTDKNPLPYPAREHLARQPVPGSYKGLLRALSAAAREFGMPMGAAAPPCAFEPHEEVTWRLPSGVRPGPLPDSGIDPADRCGCVCLCATPNGPARSSFQQSWKPRLLTGTGPPRHPECARR